MKLIIFSKFYGQHIVILCRLKSVLLNAMSDMHTCRLCLLINKKKIDKIKIHFPQVILLKNIRNGVLVHRICFKYVF